MTAKRATALLTLGFTWLILTGCATTPAQQPHDAPLTVFGAVTGDSLFTDHAPLIVPENPTRDYNRVGRAAARLDHRQREEIYIDPDDPVYYIRHQQFSTARGTFSNLIYRIHFPRVPHRLVPFHITAGRNGGLFVIVTLDAQQRPLLLTTVHTCGCYLAFAPTSYMPDDAYPDPWPSLQQRVYGETLPARLHLPAQWDPALRPLIRLREGTHRVAAIEFASIHQAKRQPTFTAVTLEPLSNLHQLPLANGTTSFFHTEGHRRGYVKNASKPWERILMGWWTLDINVGVDKRLGDPQETGRIFYTSLKPWARRRSNLWHFADFLSYWGWQL